ncbi:hypothetical protein ANRL3_00508 [Anaerolineae bacterium]|nr:hypothetical protein ANRL3_00508 [Anaerolineae bacterium]
MIQVLDAPNVIESPAHAKLKAGLLYLSGLDPDHAGARNDVGFDGKDTDFGHSLAAQCNGGRMLTPKQQFYALKMLKKYVGQLERAGLTLPAVDELPKFDSPRPPSPPTAYGSASQVRPIVYESNAKPRSTAQRDNGSITLKDKTLVVRLFPIGSFHPERVDALKATLGSHLCRYHPVDKTWHIALEALDKLTALFPDFELDELAKQAKTLVAEMAERRAENKLASVATEADLVIPGFGVTPYPFQKAGIAYALKNKRTFITDSPGLGKTIQALGTMELAQAYPTLVVCPAAVKINWKREAERCLKNKFIFIVDARTTIIPKDMDIVIINYDILGRKQALLTAYPFKMIVFDECFPYDTPVITDIGELPIGKMVEERLNVNVLSRNQTTGVTEWKPITRWIKNPLHHNLVKITHEYGTLVCTSNHQIWTEDQGYVKAETLQSGTRLRILQRDVLNSEQGKRYGEILFPQMRVTHNLKLRTCEDGYTPRTHPATKDSGLRMVRERVHNQEIDVARKAEKVLREPLCGKLAHECPWQKGLAERGFQDCAEKQGGPQRSSLFTSHETQQSNEQPRYSGKHATKIDWQKVCRAWRQRQTDSSTNQTCRTTRSFGLYRASDFNKANQKSDARFANLLQSRHCPSANENGNRSGRQRTPVAKETDTGSEEGYCTVKSRVVSVEMLERPDRPESGTGGHGDRAVYNIEVEDNHNYFANGVLVSNCHMLKNPKAMRSIASKAIAKDREYCLMMSGTPLLNRPQELLTQLEVMGQLKALGGWWHLATNFCGYQQGRGFGAPTRLGELNALLREHCYVRRLKEDVLKELPPKQRIIVPMELDNREEYEALVDQPIGNEPGAHLARIEELKQLVVKGKLNSVKQWVQEFLDTCEKLVLFAWHRDVAIKLATTFAEELRYPVPLVIGGIDKETVQRGIDAFQNREECRLIVLNIASGGVGLTLTASSNVAFVEQGWNPGAQDQAEDRVHRIGQVDSVNAWYLLAENSIDEIVYDIIAAKRAVVDEASNGVLDDDHTKYAMAREIFDQLKRRRARQ